jgi:hypothetical protein
MFTVIFAPATYDMAYNGLYYALSAVSIILLLCVILVSLRTRSKSTDRIYRNQAIGICLAALGFLFIIFFGVFLDTLTKSGLITDLLFQQSHFPIFYLGVAMIFFGIDSSIVTVLQSKLSKKKRIVNQLRTLQWGIFILTIAIATFYLLTLSTGPSGHVAQQPIFFLPIIFVILVGMIELPIMTFMSQSFLRKHFAWFSLTIFLIFIGALREATIIPSSGEPWIDLLAAFGPFTLASFCLFMSARSLKT